MFNQDTSKWKKVRVGTTVKKSKRSKAGVMRLSILDTGRKCRCGRPILVSTAQSLAHREKKQHCSVACSRVTRHENKIQKLQLGRNPALRTDFL